jgi:hypothetical protein
VRKLLTAMLPCLVLGLAGPAFARDSGHGGDHGAAQHDNSDRTATATVGGDHGAAQHDNSDRTGTATVGGGNAEAQLSNRERVDSCPLDAILANNCQPQN